MSAIQFIKVSLLHNLACYFHNTGGRVAAWSPHVYLLRHMREYVCQNPPRMKAPQRCIDNSLTAAMENPGLKYVEGFLGYMVPIRHAWNCTEDGQGLDFTLRISQGESMAWCGVELPLEAVFFCSRQPAWTLSTGCFDTASYFDERDLDRFALLLGIDDPAAYRVTEALFEEHNFPLRHFGLAC